MRIAQVAPLVESVPPRLYGGTERVVAFLTDELVSQGHDVTLFASGDSKTSARLVSPWPAALRFSGSGARRPRAAHPHARGNRQAAHEFDVLHFHLGAAPLSRWRGGWRSRTSRRCTAASIFPSSCRSIASFPTFPSSRFPMPSARRCPTPAGSAPCTTACRSTCSQFHPAPGSYLAFLGRISPEKRVDRAIAIAVACGQPLRIAAKVDPADRAYFEREIRPLLDHPLVEFVGEIDEEQKSDFLGSATALLFPIDWPEPFGLVMIEALACGVPVVAFRGGSVAGSDRPRRHRLRRRHARRGDRGHPAACRRSTAAGAARSSSGASA